MTTRNYYDILNANPNSSIDELKTNYKQLILQYHPDKLNQHYQQEDELLAMDKATNEQSAQEFVDITEAWNCLKDPIKRKEYDAQLMLNKFHTHSNTYATITLNDMKRTYHKTRNLDTNELLLPDAHYYYYYAYDCRCGGQYIIDDDSAEQFRRKHNNDDAAPRTQNNDDVDKGGVGGSAAKNDVYEEIGELIVECNECSLVIILNA
uniref:J domain-containing protein n=1 Tax=Glossina austeni TaxID=7395 RepID=A0A1A9UNF3_GLOAU